MIGRGSTSENFWRVITIFIALCSAIAACFSACSSNGSKKAAQATLDLTKRAAIVQAITARNLASFAVRRAISDLRGGSTDRFTNQIHDVVFRGLQSIQLSQLPPAIVQSLLNIQILSLDAAGHPNDPDADNKIKNIGLQLFYLDKSLGDKIKLTGDCIAVASDVNVRSSPDVCKDLYDEKSP